MSKILATIDFDGVVSPIDHDRDFNGDPDFDVLRIGGFQCAISKKVQDFLWELRGFADGQPELLSAVWASSWQDLTGYFAKDSEGKLPHFDYLSIDSGKARAIADEAIRQDADLILVFEDYESVHEDLRELQRRDMRLSGRHFIALRPELVTGLQFAQIVEAKSLIASAAQRGN